MPDLVPRPLPENAGLAFVGERVALTAAVPPRQAERMLAARNPHGKSNADILRRHVSAANLRRPEYLCQIDFPLEMDEREAALYEQPFQFLHRTVGPSHHRWWANSHADERLRATLAKLERYLATPLGTNPPEFVWLDSLIIPDDTLLAVARDDDFLAGVLQSRLVAVWWSQFHSRRAPTLAFESFPFPWVPATLLSRLTAAQEKIRLAIAQAARGGDKEQLNSAVAAAYGWPAGVSDADLLARLLKLNAQRAKSRATSARAVKTTSAARAR